MKSFDLGGTGAPLHFLHANGYPPDCYKPLLEFLKTEYHVFGMTLRPLWDGMKPEDIKDWVPFSDDLLRFLDTGWGNPASTSNEPVIGVGHSIGAMVTLRAALREPERFKALVLIDPVLFMPRRLIAWNIARAIGIGNKLHPKISGALKRRRTFDNLDIVFRGYRNREVFKYMSDENLRIYIEGITRQTEHGYELVFSPEWEARIYFTGLRDFDIWNGLKNLTLPTFFIRGAESDTFLEDAERLVHRTASRVQQKQPEVRLEALPQSTHLLPLEHPKKVFEIMQSFLKNVPQVELRNSVESRKPAGR